MNAIAKITKKYKVPCNITVKAFVDDEHVSIAVMPGDHDVLMDIDILSDLITGAKIPNKSECQVDIDEQTAKIYADDKIWTLPVNPCDPKSYNDGVWKTYCNVTKEFDIDDQFDVPLAAIKSFFKYVDKKESVRFLVKGNTLELDAHDHRNLKMSIPIKRYGDHPNDIDCVMGGFYMKRWLSLAKANTEVTINAKDDYPMTVTINVNGEKAIMLLAPVICDDPWDE